MINNGEMELSESIIMKYVKAFYNFEENYLKLIYDNPNNSNEGYLIKLKDYEDLKAKIKYNYHTKFFQYDSHDTINILDYERISQIKDIEIKSINYLINMLHNNNKYIIINKELWKIICDKNLKYNPPINYEIDNLNIILNLDNNKILFYGNSKNNILDIIKCKNFSIYNTNYEELEDIYNDIEKYNKFEKEFLKEIKKEKLYPFKNTGYLISKKLLDKWKIISDYEFIKNEYFSKVLDVDKQKIKNHLIYHLEINKYNYNDLKENGAIKYFINKKELYDYLINDSLVLIEQFTKFSFLRNKLFFNKQIQYITFQNNINISLNEELTFKTNTNIISLNYKNNNNNNINNYYNNLVHLNQLIKIFYFKEEIINNINSQHNFNNHYNSIILINKIIINKYKNYFNYNVLYQFLKNYGKIRNIPYESILKRIILILMVNI